MNKPPKKQQKIMLKRIFGRIFLKREKIGVIKCKVQNELIISINAIYVYSMRVHANRVISSATNQRNKDANA